MVGLYLPLGLKISCHVPSLQVSQFVLLCAVFVRMDTFQMLVNRIISSHTESPIPTNKPHPPAMVYPATPILSHSDPTKEGAQQAGHAQKARDYSGDTGRNCCRH